MEVLGPEGGEGRRTDGPYKENLLVGWDMAEGLRAGALLGRRNWSVGDRAEALEGGAERSVRGTGFAPFAACNSC